MVDLFWPLTTNRDQLKMCRVCTAALTCCAGRAAAGCPWWRPWSCWRCCSCSPPRSCAAAARSPRTRRRTSSPRWAAGGSGCGAGPAPARGHVITPQLLATDPLSHNQADASLATFAFNLLCMDDEHNFQLENNYSLCTLTVTASGTGRMNNSVFFSIDFSFNWPTDHLSNLFCVNIWPTSKVSLEYILGGWAEDCPRVSG